MRSEDYPTSPNGSMIKVPSMSTRCIASVLVALPLFYDTLVLLRVPKFQNMFMDMLGSKDKLPVLTFFILDHSMLLMGTFWLLAVMTAAVIFSCQRVRKVWITAILSAFLLAVAGALLSLGLFLPMATLIKQTTVGG